MLFMTCELSRFEVVSIIRHLLTGCPHCREVTGRLWELGKRTPRNADDNPRRRR